MGLLDRVKRAFGSVTAAAEAAVQATGSAKIAMAFAKFYPGGLPAFLDRLRADGHGAAVESWLGAGERRPVPASAIGAAMPEAVTARFAYDLGVPEGRVPVALAEFLPATVAQQSEGGRLKPQLSFSSLQG